MLRPADGKVALRQKVEGGNRDIVVFGDGHPQLAAFGENHMHYVMGAWDSAKPKLVHVPSYGD